MAITAMSATVQVPQIVLAEDNPADVMPVRLALKEVGLNCDLHVIGDGQDVLKRLRSTENFAQTPVIVMTASDAPQDHAQAHKHAAMLYFRKPSNLVGYMQLGVVVRDVPFLKPGPAVVEEPTA
jgi:DNA-binding NarL/FixJ family response regulator